MSNHSEQPDYQVIKELRRTMEELGQPLGATGQFPRGKLTPSDEGEIRVAIAADHKAQAVVIDFGTKVAWIGFTADQALEIADTLTKKAWELRGIK